MHIYNLNIWLSPFTATYGIRLPNFQKKLCQFFFQQHTKKVDYKALQSAYLKLKVNERVSSEEKKAFNKIENDINDCLRTCNTNVKVTLYISDTAIVVAAGKKENELEIIINNMGYVDYNWIKRKYGGLSLSKVSLKQIFLTFNVLFLHM